MGIGVTDLFGLMHRIQQHAEWRERGEDVRHFHCRGEGKDRVVTICSDHATEFEYEVEDLFTRERLKARFEDLTPWVLAKVIRWMERW